MFIFIASLKDTGFQKRGVVIKRRGGGGEEVLSTFNERGEGAVCPLLADSGGGAVSYNCARGKKRDFGQKGVANPLPCICSCILPDDQTYLGLLVLIWLLFT